MITVCIENNKDGVITGFQITGHAGFDVHGKDIVCSAVSVLGINLVNSLLAIGHLAEEKITYHQEDGILSMRLDYPSLSQAEKTTCDILLQSFEIGVTTIRDQYRNHISIQYKEV